MACRSYPYIHWTQSQQSDEESDWSEPTGSCDQARPVNQTLRSFYKIRRGPQLVGVFNKKNILAGRMDIYNGCTSWIEDECPDTISEFYFFIPFLQLLCVMISHWLTVLKHKIMSQILI